MTENKTFKRVVLSYNEEAHNVRLEKIIKYCEEANSAILELKNEFDLPLTDEEIKLMFVYKDVNPNNICEKHFAKEKSKILREEATKDLRQFLAELIQNLEYLDSQNAPFITAKKGKLTIDAKGLKDLKHTFEEALETPRAVEIYNKHNQLFEMYKEFETMVGCRAVLWLYRDGTELKKTELNYNYL